MTDAQAWFKQNTKYPDLICDMLAKYEFGDLKYTTFVSTGFRLQMIAEEFGENVADETIKELGLNKLGW